MMAGVVVWIFAAIGALTVARAVAEDRLAVPPTAESMLAGAELDVPGTDVPGLPRYANSIRAEYRVAAWDDLSVTELEYRTADALSLVRAHYHHVFATGDWKIEGRELMRGEWNYLISRGERTIEVEIERVDDMTEIEIESTEPLRPRGPRTGR
jgi:nicotinamidase-related amidase